MDRRAAADVMARLRGIGLGGRPISVRASPPPGRTLVREARTIDARRRRNTTAGFQRSGVRLDPEARMSLTPDALAHAIGKRAIQRGLTTVIDTTCGGGGNAIGFARAGCTVTAIEPVASRLNDARHNARAYGVADRIRFTHGFAEAVVPDLHGNLAFIDPPWGEAWNRQSTGINDLPVLQTILPVVEGRTPHCWIKLPPPSIQKICQTSNPSLGSGRPKETDTASNSCFFAGRLAPAEV